MEMMTMTQTMTIVNTVMIMAISIQPMTNMGRSSGGGPK
jgi:hypothetical protein